MKVLVVNASPRGETSNTLKLTRAFVQGLGDADKCEVKTFDINKLKVTSCIGCYSCWRATPGACVLKDDAREVFDYMLAADIIIWSFPLYFFGLPAKLKALIERQLPLTSPLMSGQEDVMVNGGHKFRFDMTGKKVVLISTCGFYYAPSTYDGIVGQFDMIYGEGGYEKIFCGEGDLFARDYLKKKTDYYLEGVRLAGSEFARGGITSGTRTRLEKVLYPTKFYAEIADKSWGVTDDDFNAADKDTLARVEKIKNNFK